MNPGWPRDNTNRSLHCEHVLGAYRALLWKDKMYLAHHKLESVFYLLLLFLFMIINVMIIITTIIIRAER